MQLGRLGWRLAFVVLALAAPMRWLFGQAPSVAVAVETASGVPLGEVTVPRGLGLTVLTPAAVHVESASPQPTALSSRDARWSALDLGTAGRVVIRVTPMALTEGIRVVISTGAATVPLTLTPPPPPVIAAAVADSLLAMPMPVVPRVAVQRAAAEPVSVAVRPLPAAAAFAALDGAEPTGRPTVLRTVQDSVYRPRAPRAEPARDPLPDAAVPGVPVGTVRRGTQAARPLRGVDLFRPLTSAAAVGELP